MKDFIVNPTYLRLRLQCLLPLYWSHYPYRNFSSTDRTIHQLFILNVLNDYQMSTPCLFRLKVSFQDLLTHLLPFFSTFCPFLFWPSFVSTYFIIHITTWQSRHCILLHYIKILYCVLHPLFWHNLIILL